MSGDTAGIDVNHFQLNRPEGEFADRGFPVVYADGVISMAPSSKVVKFYLYRMDPNLLGLGGSKLNPIVQIVMPIDSFLQTARFFETQRLRMIQDRIIDQSQVDAAAAFIDQATRAPSDGG